MFWAGKVQFKNQLHIENLKSQIFWKVLCLGVRSSFRDKYNAYRDDELILHAI